MKPINFVLKKCSNENENSPPKKMRNVSKIVMKNFYLESSGLKIEKLVICQYKRYFIIKTILRPLQSIKIFLQNTEMTIDSF